MNKVKKDIKKALSANEVFQIAGKCCNIMDYKRLCNIANIDEIFENPFPERITSILPFDDNSCLFIYLSKDNFGHWCMINRILEDNIEDSRIDFLDSYGEMPDEQLEYIPKNFRKKSNQLRYYLTRLFNNSGYNIHYNDKTLQSLTPDSNTCGRYAALFLKYNKTPVEEFVDTIIEKSKEYNITNDELVTIVTED